MKARYTVTTIISKETSKGIFQLQRNVIELNSKKENPEGLLTEDEFILMEEAAAITLKLFNTKVGKGKLSPSLKKIKNNLISLQRKLNNEIHQLRSPYKPFMNAGAELLNKTINK